MLYSDQEILSFIQTNYPGYENYHFSEEPIDEQRPFIVVKDIHEINEDILNISKDIFIRDLKENRQTNSINISNICDSLNAESCDMGEEVYKALKEYNRIYTKAYIRNGSRWVDLKAFNLACDKAKELICNKNPRVLFSISKYSHLLNAFLFNSANLRLSLVSLRCCLELMHAEIRKMNYDMVMRPVTTTIQGNDCETLIQTKYVTNFFLHKDIMFDHEYQVFGTIAGIAARKQRGVFAKIKPYYYQFNLYDLLAREYAYLQLTIEVSDKAILINHKQIAHKVLLKKRKIGTDFSSFSKLTAKRFLKRPLPKETYIYDYSNPIELDTLSASRLKELIDSREGMLVYQVDKTLYDSYSTYDTSNPQSAIIVEKGELFNAYYNLFGVQYGRNVEKNSLWHYPAHLLIFSKTLQSDQVQRIRMFDSMMYQQQNAIIRAKQAEEALLELQKSNEKICELNTNLQSKVDERTKELQLINEQKTHTFINLAHETKTPLTLIQNYLQEYVAAHGESKELTIIKKSIGKLTKDIVNFFDIEKVDKKFNLYDHDCIADFSQILNECLPLFIKYAAKKNSTIEASVEDNQCIRANPQAVTRIINNLIENAIRYTPQNGNIRVTLFTRKTRILFSVEDNGPGIPKNLHEKIFEPYYQVKTEKKNYQGMGLGLPIVKVIADALEAELNLMSDPQIRQGTQIVLAFHKYVPNEDGHFTEFEKPVDLPVDIGTTDTLSDEIPDKERPTILVIEDHVPLLNYIVSKLKVHYNTLTATGGNEALEKMETVQQLDLIISDIMMDDGDGIEFLNRIAQHNRYKHLPLIFITAKQTLEDKLEALSLGAIDYIHKPFLIEELLVKVDTILRNFQKQRKALVDAAYKSLLITDKQAEASSEKTDQLIKECRIKYNLTSRETEVIRLIAEGGTNKTIAEKLFISDKTVAKHIQNIFEKVGVNNRLELLNRFGIPHPNDL